MIPVHRIRRLARFPHDPAAFTQGLFWHGGCLYESTGLVGASTLRRVRLEDGAVLQSTDFPGAVFGEGIALCGDEIVGLTWRDRIGFRWNKDSLTLQSRFAFPGEAWGLASDGACLVLSDGTADLRFLDPGTLAEQRRLSVTAGGRPLPLLNALQWIDGEIWANIWGQPVLARIDPATGATKALADLSPLLAESGGGDPERVANGIAWDEDGRRLFVTGKNWPWLYQIAVEPEPAGYARLAAA